MNKVKPLKKEEAFKLVFRELKQIGLFNGKYDAYNGTEEFMFGVSAVMNYIACEAGDEFFEDEFVKNMIEAQKKGGVC